MSENLVGDVLLAVAVGAELVCCLGVVLSRTIFDRLHYVAAGSTVPPLLVLAALIIGAALLMKVETAFRLFGYPGIAMLCFLGAAAGGFWLVISIFVQDYRTRRRLKTR